MKKQFLSSLTPSSTLKLALVALLAGCATARIVSVQPGKGGVIAVIPAQDPEARQKAVAMMTGNCGSRGYEVTEEGEAVIGQNTQSSGNASLLGGSLYSNGSSSTHQETEWRIKYKCK